MKKYILPIISISFVVTLLFAWNYGLFGNYGNYGYRMFNGHMFFGGGFIHIFWMILFFYLIYKLFSGNEKYLTESKFETAEEVLKKRYAKGEINKDEFEEKLNDIKNK